MTWYGMACYQYQSSLTIAQAMEQCLICRKDISNHDDRNSHKIILGCNSLDSADIAS